MKEILKFVIIVFVCGFFSCNEDLDRTLNEQTLDVKNNDLAKNYLNFFTTKNAEGSVLIQSTTSSAMQNLNKNITFAEKTLRTSQKSSNSNKRIEIKGFDTTTDSKSMKNSSKDKNNFFGKVLSYRVIDDSYKSKSYENKSSETSNEYSDVYIPELINIDFSTNNLEPGTTVTWNVDNLNQNGVIISVEYYAINQLNTKLAFDNTSTIKRSFVLDDSIGSYTITQEDLEMFPNNSLLDINVLRAGFDTDETSDLSIAGLTKVGDTKLTNY